LRLLPLLDVVLVDLEVDPLHLLGRLDLDPAEERLEEVEDRSGRFQELGLVSMLYNFCHFVTSSLCHFVTKISFLRAKDKVCLYNAD
jgi:hypothetical protein